MSPRCLLFQRLFCQLRQQKRFAICNWFVSLFHQNVPRIELQSTEIFFHCVKGPLTDLFKPFLREIYSHVTLPFLVSSELDVFHVC